MADVCIVDSTDPAITVIALNRPEKRNALNIELIDGVTRAVQETAADVRRRVLILRGAGTVFCAGLDLHEAANPAVADRSAQSLAALYAAVCESPLITIAAAQGGAFGGGAGLIAACDLVVASEDLRIGFPEVHRGLWRHWSPA